MLVNLLFCPKTGFYTKLNVWGSLGLNFDYDGGPINENGVPSFYISFKFWKVVHPSVKGFEQALAVKQVSQNIKSFSYLSHIYLRVFTCRKFTREELTTCEIIRPKGCQQQQQRCIDRNFRSFLGAGF